MKNKYCFHTTNFAHDIANIFYNNSSLTYQTLRKKHIQIHLNQKNVQVKNEIIFKHYMDIHLLSTVDCLLYFNFFFLILSLDLSINEKGKEKEVNIILVKLKCMNLFKVIHVSTPSKKMYCNQNYPLIKLHS